MGKQRQYRTPAQRLADAQAAQQALITRITRDAATLVVQASGWKARSIELSAKSESAIAKAQADVAAAGLDWQDVLASIPQEHLDVLYGEV